MRVLAGVVCAFAQLGWRAGAQPRVFMGVNAFPPAGFLLARGWAYDAHHQPRSAVGDTALPEFSNDVTQLAAELHDHGWFVFSSKTDHGD